MEENKVQKEILSSVSISSSDFEEIKTSHQHTKLL